MKIRSYPELEEMLYTRKLDNGLTVYVLPKPGFAQKIAYFVTDFGSIHTDFEMDGQQYHVPAGVAHFLEHKMFELPDRDVTAEFAALGANVNAFTGFDTTAYYFSCTDHFDENLHLLLEFVSTPWFPEESVQREMGIIDQEIAMYEDAPDSREFEALMAKMYRKHPVRVPILGTRESIRQITPQILHLCHRGFYTPANMVLCVIGDVDAQKVMTIAEEVLGTSYHAPAQKLRQWEESMTCESEDARLSMEVAMPTFQLGFKCEASDCGPDTIRSEIVGYLAAELLFGEATQLYLDLYEQGIIDGSFGGGFETIDGCAMLTCGGDSDYPEQVRRALLQRGSELAQGITDAQAFLRLKRGTIGRRIRDIDNFDTLCYRICACHFQNFEYLRFPEIYATITEEEVCQFIARVITPQRCATAITTPLHDG